MSTSPPLSDILDDPEYTLPGRNGFWHRARRSPSFIAGVVITGIIVLVAILAPWISPYSPDHQDLYNILSGFSARHLLGTDQLGRDELSRLLWASRTDLQVGVIAVIFPFCFGTLMGTLTGYFGGWFDAIVMRIVDVVIAFPFYVFVIGLVFVVGEGTKGIYIAFAVVDWVIYARAVRSTTLIVRESDYVAAAKGGGLSHWRVILRHVLPNTITQAVVYVMNDIVLAIVAVVTLGYIGLGIQPPTPDWGTMISDGQPFITTHWELATLPGIAVVLVGLGLSLLGDGLADVLRPSS
jgi:peptide/nickel transport system permease protein